MQSVTTSVLVTNDVGLHARPSVKLTQRAKTFEGAVEIATSPTGPWVDAKSPVKVMRVKIPKGAWLHIRAEQPEAAASLVALVESRFEE